MGDSPKVIKEKYNRILNAWKTLAFDKTFGGMTLTDFEAQIEKSNTHRQRIDILDHEIKEAQANRETEDRETLKTCDLIVKNVLADPEYGDNSVLYEKMGYIRKANRKSGLTRKRTSTEGVSP